MKKCTDCKITKALEDFPNRKSSKDGKANQCRPCNSKRARDWQKANPERVKQRIKVYDRNRHELSEEQFAALINLYNGLCWLCKEQPGTCIDHDHKCCPGTYSCGKCVRGWLCQNCNRGLGMFKDSLDLLAKATHYLGVAQLV